MNWNSAHQSSQNTPLLSPSLAIPQCVANHCQTLNQAIFQSRYIHLAVSISIPHLIISLQLS